MTADPTWTSFLVTPNFPEYVSGHSTFSMAAATVLDAFFGDNVTFTTTELTTALSMTYHSFQQAATDAGMSRLYGGIHFLFSIQDGWTEGASVANFDMATFSVTRSTTPPKVNLNNVLPSGASNGNVTITGQATDNLSGVASLQVQVDRGAYAPLTFDANGNFSFTTSFALTGAADGSHTINFQATNNAGTTSNPVAFTFTLTTTAPTLTITSPSNNGALAAGATLTGTFTTENNVPIVCLCYAFDGSTTMTPVPFNTDGSFSHAARSFAARGGPAHPVGGSPGRGRQHDDQTLHLTLTTLIPLIVTSLTPPPTPADVSVTFRPQVFFSRPIDTTTLTSANFYASDSTGTPIPATIVPANDGTAAWLFFSNPLESSSTITITVNGATIKDSSGNLLDAANSGTPGSTLTSTFTTVSVAPVPGTTVSGIVADPGPDGQPGTRDDVRAGANGILGTADDTYLFPIAGATIFIIGEQNQTVTSAADGSFTLLSVPVGDVKLVVDGRTATNAPSGVFYPEMVFDLTVQPGVANTVMGTMGTTQEQAAMGTAKGVYLPRIQQNVLQTAGEQQRDDHRAECRCGHQHPDGPASLRILDHGGAEQPGRHERPEDVERYGRRQHGVAEPDPRHAAAGRDATGHHADHPGAGRRHVLDAGVDHVCQCLQGGAGTQLDVYSFNHTTGDLEITGTATVSADGKTVTTDPDSGITHPGWFGVTPPGSNSNDPPPPCPPVTPPNFGPVAPDGPHLAALERRHARAGHLERFHRSGRRKMAMRHRSPCTLTPSCSRCSRTTAVLLEQSAPSMCRLRAAASAFPAIVTRWNSTGAASPTQI